ALTSATGAVRPTAAAIQNDDKAIVHVLNRIAFGPRVADVAAVRETGLQRYIDQQLHPERIADTEMAARLSGLTTLGMSSREIAERYEVPQLEMRRARQLAARGANPNEPAQPPQLTPEMQQRANQVVVELS